MKKFLKMLRYARPYSHLAVWNIVFNFLSIISGLFTFAMIMPFLRFLFGMEEESVSSEGTSWFTKAYQEFILWFKNLVGEDLQLGLLIVVLLVLVSTILKNVFRYLALYVLVPYRNNTVRDIRNDLYKKVMRLQLSYFTEERKGDIISRMSNDVKEVEFAIMTSLEAMFKEPFTMLITLTLLISISPGLTLLMVLLIPITAFIISRIGSRIKKFASRGQGRLGDLISLFEESLGGIRIIKGFGKEPYFFRKFMKENRHLNRINIVVNRAKDLSSPLSETLGIATLCVILYFGGRMVQGDDSSLEPEVFIYYLMLFYQIITPAKSFSNAFYNVQKGVASVERIEEVLAAEERVQESDNPVDLAGISQGIEFRQVSFSYSKEKTTLADISFEIPKGKTVALVGESGGGKSTIADLLARFHDVDHGHVLIDGVDIRDYRMASLRKHIGIVTQESILFNDSIYNNIAFGNHEVSQEQVVEAAKIANAHEFISQLKLGYSTNIGERGGKLSGGQKQRIAIARAVLSNPEILILDEATSALDTSSERLVQEALDRLMRNRTSLVIAHRLSTIQNADMIIVVENGSLREMGSHTELITKSGTYKKLLEMQQMR